MDNLFSQKVINANNVFADDFLDVKILVQKDCTVRLKVSSIK